ncbi:hypothetical protein I5R46_23535, partial [Pseudomonas aeruginosa]|nr:hypothetical protein [Pseudomonas aeruginosa]
MSERERWQLELDKLQRGLQGDPFAFLGPQRDPGGEGGVGGGGSARAAGRGGGAPGRGLWSPCGGPRAGG